MTNLIFTKEINEFGALIKKVSSYGTRWNPTQDRLKLAKLQAQLDALKTLHNQLAAAHQHEGETIHARRQAMQNTLKLARKIRLVLNIHLGEDHPQYAILEQLFRQINHLGSNKTNPKPGSSDSSANNSTTSSSPNKRSTYQSSFTDRLDQIERFTVLLKNVTDYEPNEESVSTEAWEAQVAQLHTLNTQYHAAQATLKQLRSKRETLNEQLKTVEREIKTYLKVLLP